ncbi:MAG: beta-glucosidase [Rhodobacteraceae bacterium]|nr:beta-glucosidase [Paracoccaceae bacterium]
MSNVLPIRADFPPGFQFGTATSAYQIEGQDFGGAGDSHWDALARRKGAIQDGSSGAVACDHYHRFGEDLDLAAPFDAYRFSVNWSRVLPDGRGPANPAALDFYDRLTDAILERGLKPNLTLYHWDIPQALSELGGWRNRDVAKWFGDFTEVIIGQIGDRMTAVSTINEPFCVAWVSHMEGAHAPGMKDVKATAHAMHNVLLAHGEAMRRLRAMGQKNLGIVLNFEAVQAFTNSQADLSAAVTRDAVINRWFIEAITKGRYPDEALIGFEPLMPENWQADMELIQAPLDWLGVNYYTICRPAAAPDLPWPAMTLEAGPLEKTAMGWEVFPQGLKETLKRLRTDYTGDLPLYVTENGAAFDANVENGRVSDPQRTKFIDQHMRAVLAEIKEGGNIKGFYYWSLLDNFEWSYGYEQRFGLVHVEYDSQKRTPKDSYHHLVHAVGRSKSD